MLEMSVIDKGGRQQWSGGYAPAAQGTSSSTAVVSTSTSKPLPSASSSRTQHSPTPSTSSPIHAQPSYAAPAAAAATPPPMVAVTRVRALHSFEPSEPGELAFEKGDISSSVSNSARSFSHFLTEAPEKKKKKDKTVAFPKVATDDLAENFSEISLSYILSDPNSKPEYDSALTQAWTASLESNSNSRGPVHLPHPMPFGLRSASVAFQAVLPKLQCPGKEPMFEYSS